MAIWQVVRAIPAVIRESATRAGPGSRLGTVLVVLAAAQAVVAVGLSLTAPGTYRELIREDGPVEAASALWWFLAAVIALGALLLPVVRRARSVLAYGALAAFFVVSGGEEISWGQRIFGFAGPDAVVEINKQHETNLHNIGSISVYANLFLLLTLFVFVLWPALVVVRGGPARLATTRRLPVVTGHATLVYLVWVAAWIIVGVRSGTLGFHPFSLWGEYTQLDDELFEYGVAQSFLCLVVLDLAGVVTGTRGGARRG
ncbi:hypothetical protein [Pseudonocardia zijingensis]|jgi:hypothetical protein|uniref:Uncharacterized protein n=1 Tax=Pseudonocardia zijingensis TaxID=153376 RepID=A0ABN1NJP3_9PSEU